MSKRNGKVTLTNRELGAAQAALRVCGNTSVPMAVAMRMVDVQHLLKDRIDKVNEVNKTLIERHGTPAEGEEKATRVSDEMPGFHAYLDEFKELMDTEFEVNDHFILYQKGDEFGWTENVKTPIALTPNTIFDMASLLEIKTPAKPKPKKAETEPELAPEPVT